MSHVVSKNVACAIEWVLSNHTIKQIIMSTPNLLTIYNKAHNTSLYVSCHIKECRMCMPLNAFWVMKQLNINNDKERIEICVTYDEVQLIWDWILILKSIQLPLINFLNVIIVILVPYIDQFFTDYVFIVDVLDVFVE